MDPASKSLENRSDDSADVNRDQREFLSIIHLGGINRAEVMDMLLVISASATIKDAVILSGVDGKHSLRVEMLTEHSKMKEARLELARLYPNVRFKLMSTGKSSLSRKLYTKIARVHSKPILTGYFSAFGEVRKIELKFNSSTNRSRNFCYITFSSSESAQKAVQFGEHIIAGKSVTCFACKPFDIRSRDFSATVIELAEELEKLKTMSIKRTTLGMAMPLGLDLLASSDSRTAKTPSTEGLRLAITHNRAGRQFAVESGEQLLPEENTASPGDLQYPGISPVKRMFSGDHVRIGKSANNHDANFHSVQMLGLVNSNHLKPGNLVFNVLARIQRR